MPAIICFRRGENSRSRRSHSVQGSEDEHLSAASHRRSRAAISSRIRRNIPRRSCSVPVACDGSSKLQWRRLAWPEKTGLEACPLISIPTSAIARIARGWTRVASVPALATSKRSPAMARRNPSAVGRWAARLALDVWRTLTAFEACPGINRQRPCTKASNTTYNGIASSPSV